MSPERAPHRRAGRLAAALALAASWPAHAAPDGLARARAHREAHGARIVREEPDLATRRAHPKLVRVVREEGYPAARTPMDLPIAGSVVAAIRRAGAAAGLGEPVLLPGMGGSLPLYLFTERLGQPCLVVPVANHDNNQHAPDENLRIANLWYAIDLYGALLTIE